MLCKELVRDRLSSLERELQFLAEAIAEDTKSSAGDKYETSREMANLERQKLSGQLAQNKKALSFLSNLKPVRMSEVQSGALLETNKGLIYIAVSLGQIDVAGHKILVISPQAPLAQLLLGGQKGDEVSFNNQQYRLLSVS